MPASWTPGRSSRPRSQKGDLEAEQWAEALPLGAGLAPALAGEPQHLARARPRVGLEGRLARLAERLAALDEPRAQLGDGEAREVLGAHRGGV